MVADPQGAPFYVMKPIPPEGRENEQERRLLARPAAARRLERASTSDPAAARDFYTRQFGWDEQGDSWIWATWANIASSTMAARARRDDAGALPRQPTAALALLFSACRRSDAEASCRAEAAAATIHMGPMEVPGGDHIVIGTDPQGAEFALVGKA